MSFVEYIERFGKRCPFCGSGQISSMNSSPLAHRCIACNKKFFDTEAARPPEEGWPVKEKS